MSEIIRTSNIEGNFLEPVHPQNGSRFTADEVRAIVGGYYEPLALRNGDILYYDADGALREKPINLFATRFAKFATAERGTIYAIHGDVLVANENHKIE